MFKVYLIIKLYLLFIFQPCLAINEVVDVKDVVKSTFTHHPLILSQLKMLEQSENYLLRNQGAFDLTLKSDAQGYTDGYYDGKAFSAFLEKPLYYMNAKAYAGFRQSDGEFPIYYNELVTQNQGEAFAGAMVSLLRGRNIDEKRFKFLLAKQDLVQSELELNLMYIELQTMAAQAYYKWLADLERVRVQKEILSLAESRIQNFSTRIRKGDLAKIYGVENEKYILKRKYELNSSLQKLYVSAVYLSLFLRDENGMPVILKSTNPSKVIGLKQQKFKSKKNLLAVVNNQDLDIKTLQSQKIQSEADRKMGANDLMPRLDLKYEISDDQGAADPKLDPLEQNVFLNLEIPIERRFGVGRKRAAQAKIDALKFKIQFKREKNRTLVLSLLNNLKLFKSNYELTKREISLSDQLRRAELIKFNKGASDFILVNLREESLAESKIKNLTAYLDYNSNFIELQRLAVEFIIPPKTNSTN